MDVVAHNLLAMNANRQFNITNKNKAKSTEKLASGYRINRAADDAAGLSISEKVRRQIRGLSQGIRNTEDGVSLCQVADGALAEVSNMLHRITELSIKSANGTNSPCDRQAIQDEIGEILQEIDRIGETTTFNEHKIFKSDDSESNIIGYKTENQTVTHDIDIDKSFLFNVSGTPSDTFAISYIVDSSGSNGLSINSDVDAIKWTDIKDSNGNSVDLSNIQAGIYKFEYKGMTVSFDVDEAISEDDFKAALNGLSWSTKETGGGKISFSFSGSIRGGSYSSSVYDNSDFISVELRTDETRLKIDSGGHFGNFSFEMNELLNSNGDKFEGDNIAPGVYTGTLEVDKGDINNYNKHYVKVDFSLSINDTNTVSASDILNYMKNNWGSRLLSFRNNVDTSHTFSSADENLNKKIEVDTVNYIPSYKKHETITEDVVTKIPIYKNESVQSHDAMEHSLWIQSGCDAGDGMFLEIDPMNTSVLGIDDLDVSTIDGAYHAMDAVNDALTKLSANRSKIGAQQNRLEHTIDNENNIVENTTAAESHIRDTDMAEEMVAYSKANILEQAGQAMIAQANQSNQGILSLLQ